MLGLAARLGDARLRPAVLLGSAGRHTTVHVRPRVPRDVLGWASLPAAAPPLMAGGGLTGPCPAADLRRLSKQGKGRKRFFPGGIS